MKKRFVSLALSSLMLVGAACGCSGGKGKNADYDTDALKKASYPVKTDVELTMFMNQGGSAAQQKAEDGAKLFVDLLYEKTGIKVKRIVPPLGQEEQQFNIMIASGEMTDIITWSWGNFLGGADKAVTDGYIISLNDLMSDYTPNFKKLLESDPELDKMVKSDNGNYCYFPGMNQKGDGDVLMLTSGYMFRKDWLDELGLPVPETVDDWYNTLKAFKEQKGAAAPFSMSASDSSYGLLGLAGAYGITLDFYKDDNGKIQFGYVQPQCKDFLAMMNKWYSEGLIDKNISNVDGKTLDSCLLNGKTGAVFGWLGGGMGKWLTAAKSLGMESFDLVGVPAPVLNRGDRVKYASKEMPVAVTGQAISSQTKHKELAAKFLDYGYSEEGHMLYNFGEEGVTYNMVDGQPVYTDFILNNKNGKTIDDQLSYYTHALGKGPFVMDTRYIKFRYNKDQQKQAQINWGDNDVDKYQIPYLTPSAEESKEFATIMNNINTYTSEMYMQFVVGKKPLSEFDSFVSQIKDYGIDRAIEIKQAALDRYNAR